MLSPLSLVYKLFLNVACFCSRKSEDNDYGETSPDEKTMVENIFNAQNILIKSCNSIIFN
jgi:hypothetical protein